MKGTKARAGSPARSLPRDARRSGDHSAGSRILAAINEATEVLRTEGLGSGLLTVRTYRVPAAPPVYRPKDVQRVWKLLGASQAVLAGFLGVNVNTLRSWEQGKRLPQPIACRFLFEIESDVAAWRRRILNQTSAVEREE
jgi:putative transcriptional regulator